MSLKDDLEVAKGLVAKLEAKLAAIPAEIVNKTEQEIADIYHAIAEYFHGHDKVPAPTPQADSAPVDVPPQTPAA